MSDKSKLVQALHHAAVMLEILEPGTFRSRAYFGASRLIEDSPFALSELVEEKRALEIKGIGQSLFSQIKGFYHSGELPMMLELAPLWPAGLWDVLRVPGLGPKKVAALYHELGIASLSELEYACNENRLITLKGFGRKTQDSTLTAIARLKAEKDLALYDDAASLVDVVSLELSALPGVERFEISGDFRRGLPVVDGLLFVAAVLEERNAFSAVPWLEPAAVDTLPLPVLSVLAGEREGMKVSVLCVKPEDMGVALVYTSSDPRYLAENGFSPHVRAVDTKAYFSALGLPYRSSLQRESLLVEGDVSALPLTRNHLKGVLHVHTDYSDGSASLLGMARAARDMGFLYLGVADHSQTAVYARGLTEERVREQWAEIERLNAWDEFQGFRILRGIESDILPDGSLDYPDDLLSGFDFVIASVHSSFRLSPEDMTARLLAAVRHPAVTILGHPHGRILLGRPGYQFDFPAVLAACREHGTALELNCNPHRMDIGWEGALAARRAGVKVAINPDAHHPEHLIHVDHGLRIANKAGLTVRDLLAF